MGMKVAVSIPDTVFAEAEIIAARLKTSRSDVYARALGEFISHHAPDSVTRLLDEAVDATGTAPDSIVTTGARQTLKHTEW
jgi:metal-responsive CopG/Arc/MetJ family transcriptional regulator